MTEPDFSEKFSFGLNWGKKTQNDSIMDFFNIAKSGHFAAKDLKLSPYYEYTVHVHEKILILEI